MYIRTSPLLKLTTDDEILLHKIMDIFEFWKSHTIIYSIAYCRRKISIKLCATCMKNL